MLNYWGLLISVLFFSFQGQAQEKDYISDQLFFEEALANYHPGIDIDSITISEDLAGLTELRLNNFVAKASYMNSLGTDYPTYQVGFTMKDHQVSCLGSILSIDHALLKTDQGKEFQERSGLVYLSECTVSDGKQTGKFPPNFSIEYNVAFPKVSSLPIAAENSLERYRLLKEYRASTSNKLLQCMSADTNAFEMPRFGLQVHEMEDHYTVGVLLGSSSISLEEKDVPIDAGEQDLGSLPWYKDNIEFFANLGGQGSAFSISFKKSDCQIVGNKESMTIMLCTVDIPEENRIKNIERVSFEFTTKVVTEPLVLPQTSKSETPKIKMVSTPQFDVKVQFVIDQPNKYIDAFNKTHYHNTIHFKNDDQRGNECQFASQHKPKESKEKQLPPDEELI